MKYGWSLCVQQWRELASALVQFTWQKVHVIKGMAEHVPQESGVYMLCTMPPQSPSRFWEETGLFNALYVGQAENLHARFKDYSLRRKGKISRKALHILDELSGKGERISFVFSVVPVEQLRDTEGRLIHCLGPSGNERDEIKLRGKLGRPTSA